METTKINILKKMFASVEIRIQDLSVRIPGGANIFPKSIRI